jgi:N6-L-threonylcarbamoyladenine synthase
MRVILGIDTSCYTTSVALLGEDGTLLADARRMLSVKQGGRGLAQSEMVYQHTRNLPEVFAAALADVGKSCELTAVGASACPRNQAGSFMPAFLVGQGYGKVLAMSHALPFFALSHQENHILAGIWSAGGPVGDDFLAVHVSGGTTELTAVSRKAEGLDIRLLGGSGDIAAGQLVDRIGVALDLPFPAGSHLEIIARQGTSGAATLPVAVKGMTVSFSGPETHARRLLAQGVKGADVALGVEECIAEALTRLIIKTVTAHSFRDILIVGGVAANSFIRNYIVEHVNARETVRFYFPAKEFSGDNAVGSGYFALCRRHNISSPCI